MKNSKKNHEAHILITVRLKSKRLKRKALLKLGNLKLVQHQIKRLKRNFPPKNIIIITSKKKEDLILKKIAMKEKIQFYQGQSNDVLKRMFGAATKFNLTNFINCTGDNPFVDPFYAKKIYEYHMKKKFDFTTTKKLPIGVYSFVVKTKALEKVIKSKRKRDTEIWSKFFLSSKKYKCGIFNNIKKKHKNLSLRLTIDEFDDYLLAQKIIKLTNKNIPSLDEILKCFIKYPYLKQINSKIEQRI